MNYFTCCLLLAVVGSCWATTGLVFSESPYYNSLDRIDVLKLRLQASLMQLCPDKSRTVINQTTDGLTDCAEEIDLENTVCSILENDIPRCMTPVVDMIRECTSSNLPQHLLKMIKSATHYFCKSDVEHMLELMNPCGRPNPYSRNACSGLMRSKMRQYQNRVPSKTEFCESLASMRSCYTSQVRNSCKNTISREAFIGIYDSILEPCNQVDETDETERKEEIELF